jgi:tRNA (adenine22-N1)-methyltransferase
MEPLASKNLLRPRLAAVASLCPQATRLADVGSDHGRLPLALLASGRASFALATERTGARAERIGRPPTGAAWEARFAVRAGDGLAPLRPEDALDTIVISGLGGRSIVRILSGGRLPLLAPSFLVLQPCSEAAGVRAWLSANGWRPGEERLDACRGRRHVTLRAEPGDDAHLYRDDRLSREDLLAAGPLLARSGGDEVVAAWRETRERLRRILASPRLGAGTAIRARTEMRRAERILARLGAA